MLFSRVGAEGRDIQSYTPSPASQYWGHTPLQLLGPHMACMAILHHSLGQPELTDQPSDILLTCAGLWLSPLGLSAVARAFFGGTVRSCSWLFPRLQQRSETSPSFLASQLNTAHCCLLHVLKVLDRIHRSVYLTARSAYRLSNLTVLSTLPSYRSYRAVTL